MRPSTSLAAPNLARLTASCGERRVEEGVRGRKRKGGGDRCCGGRGRVGAAARERPGVRVSGEGTEKREQWPLFI